MLTAKALRLIAMLGAFVALGTLAAPVAGAADWTQPLGVSVPASSSSGPDVALDPQGDAVAVWQRSDGLTNVVQAALRPAGSGAWQAPVDLAAGGEPQVAFDSHGNAVAVWTRGDGTIQAAVRPAGGPWQSPLDLSAAGALNPQIAADPDGDAIAIWSRGFVTMTATAQAAFRPATSGVWQSVLDVSATATFTMLTVPGPQVAFDPHGNAIAVWSQFNGLADIVQAAMRPAGGSWQMPIDLSAAGQNSQEAQIAFDAQGNAIAVWDRFDGTNRIVQAAVRPVGAATWSSPLDLSAAGVDANQPRIAFDANGTAFVIWEALGTGGAYVIQATQRPAATGMWLAPAINLSVGGHSAVEPNLAVNAAGDALAIWSRFDGAHNVVQTARRSAATGAWGPPKELSAVADNSVDPQLAVDAQGDAVAVWRHLLTTTTDVQAAAYDATGPLLESLLIPASGTAGVPVAFSVAPRDAWSALGTTTWNFGDGTSAAATNVAHAYAAAGTFAVTVTGTDALGNPTLATGSIAIAPSPVVTPRAQLQITAASLSRTRFRASGTHATRSKTPIGTQIHVTLSATARLLLGFTAKRTGLNSGTKCAVPTAKLRKRHAAHCTRTVMLGRIERARAAQGRTVIAFNGHLAGKRLPAGAYSVKLAATDTAGDSAMRTLRFTIVA